MWQLIKSNSLKTSTHLCQLNELFGNSITASENTNQTSPIEYSVSKLLMASFAVKF